MIKASDLWAAVDSRQYTGLQLAFSVRVVSCYKDMDNEDTDSLARWLVSSRPQTTDATVASTAPSFRSGNETQNEKCDICDSRMPEGYCQKCLLVRFKLCDFKFWRLKLSGEGQKESKNYDREAVKRRQIERI